VFGFGLPDALSRAVGRDAQGFRGIESPVAISAEKCGHDRVGELLRGLVECSVVDRHGGRAGVGADVVDAGLYGTNSWMILA
jgi:hypothetical protein